MRQTAHNRVRTAVLAAVATAMAATALPAAAAPLSAAAAGGFSSASSLPIVQVKNGRNAAIFGALAGVTALGVGAAIASRNQYDGYGYEQQGYYQQQGYYGRPGYYAQPAPVYGGGMYGGPVVVEEPQVYGGGYGPGRYYRGGPTYYEEPIVTYDNRPTRRHHAGGPGKRNIDNFRDGYR